MTHEFKEKTESHVKLLKQYTPILARVHGPNHPELAEVNELVKSLTDKIGKKDADLSEEFGKLREVSSNYEVPSDGCETYEAVYTMLSELDEAFSK